MSWLPMDLKTVGALVGQSKVPLPAFTDADDAWVNRCKTDVEILRLAMRDIWDWIESEDLGVWQRTGAGMAWSNWKHRHMTDRILCSDDESFRVPEATSCYTGRCEAWMHGRLKKNTFTEWDLPLCYPTIAKEVLLPTQLHSVRHYVKWQRDYKVTPGYRKLYQATATTDSPTLPTQGPNGIYWPVGTFDGYWWDVEIENALAHGATFELHGIQTYRSKPALQQWATWIIDYINSGDDVSTPVRRAVAKHWSRSLVGRFAMQYSPWQDDGAAFPDDFGIHSIVNVDTDEVGEVLTLGDKRWVAWSKQWGADTHPALLAAVMAEARVRLWQLMVVAGLENVAYVDTDSLVTNDEGSERLAQHVAKHGAWGLRVKQRFVNLTILGPRQRLNEGMPAISGVPSGAERIGESKWTADTWESLSRSLRKSRPNAVVITQREFNTRGVDTRRVHLGDGRTSAVDVGPSVDSGLVSQSA
ncbi:MAG: hypothetical protein WAM97_10570 [Acidimicrobiales bacterium]